jgi:hypothetical protein
MAEKLKNILKIVSASGFWLSLFIMYIVLNMVMFGVSYDSITSFLSGQDDMFTPIGNLVSGLTLLALGLLFNSHIIMELIEEVFE